MEADVPTVVLLENGKVVLRSMNCKLDWELRREIALLETSPLDVEPAGVEYLGTGVSRNALANALERCGEQAL